MTNTHLTFTALPHFPMVQAGDNLADLIIQSLTHAQLTLRSGDILVICSKIISKAENRYVDLTTISPSERAHELAQLTRKDPRVVELILQNSTLVSRTAPNVLVVRHLLGFISANAGIDASNVGAGQDVVLLLPENPDDSAFQLQQTLQQAYQGIRLGIVISDTHGRPFRFGNIGVAIGSAGIPVLVDQRGEQDLFGYVLQATLTPLADELAAAAGLVTGQAAEGQPVVLVRGVQWATSSQTAHQLIRPPEHDLYG